VTKRWWRIEVQWVGAWPGSPRLIGTHAGKCGDDWLFSLDLWWWTFVLAWKPPMQRRDRSGVNLDLYDQFLSEWYERDEEKRMAAGLKAMDFGRDTREFHGRRMIIALRTDRSGRWRGVAC